MVNSINSLVLEDETTVSPFKAIGSPPELKSEHTVSKVLSEDKGLF